MKVQLGGESTGRIAASLVFIAIPELQPRSSTHPTLYHCYHPDAVPHIRRYLPIIFSLLAGAEVWVSHPCQRLFICAHINRNVCATFLKIPCLNIRTRTRATCRADKHGTERFYWLINILLLCRFRPFLCHLHATDTGILLGHGDTAKYRRRQKRYVLAMSHLSCNAHCKRRF